jgi:hypothetical protein
MELLVINSFQKSITDYFTYKKKRKIEMKFDVMG